MTLDPMQSCTTTCWEAVSVLGCRQRGICCFDCQNGSMQGIEGPCTGVMIYRAEYVSLIVRMEVRFSFS